MQAVIWIDPDQMRVERRVMNLGHGEAVRNYGMAETLVLVRHNVRRVQQQRFLQTRDSAAAVVSSDDCLAKRPGCFLAVLSQLRALKSR